ERNLEGQMVVDFAKRMDMAVVNTYFQKREEHRVTYKSGGRRTQVDYILCRRGNLEEISDCKVVVGESVARQHRMVVCRMTLMVSKKKRSKIEKKTKWWKLKKEECCEEFRQKLRQALGGQVVLPDDWETIAEVIRETERKGSIQRKRLAKKKWDMDRTEENRQEYKELQCRVKREVSKAKQKAYDGLYTRLDTREGEKDLYRVLTSEESVQRRWKEYFEELMNEENEREKRVEGVNSVEQKIDKIRKDEVRTQTACGACQFIMGIFNHFTRFALIHWGLGLRVGLHGFNILFIHFVYRLSDLHSGHGEPVPISGIIGHQGRIHPGQSANPSQGTHTLSFTHARTTDNLEMPINLQGMSLDWGEETGVPGGNPRGTGRTCKLHTHGRGRNQTPNLGVGGVKADEVG
ncbi:hypothetical protein QTP70_020053, partial [Hemibagrus guttatus]